MILPRPLRPALGLLAAALVVLPAQAARGDTVEPAIEGMVEAFADHPVVAVAEEHGIRQAGDFYEALVREPAPHSELETNDARELDRRSFVEWGDSTKAGRFVGLGAVEEFTLPSKVFDERRRVWVYTPPGYAGEGPDNNLLLVFDGETYLSEIPLPAYLDSLVAAGRMPPTVAVMTDNASGSTRLADLANRQRFVDFVATELVPWVRRNWRVSADPHRATVTGSSAGGLAAAFLALRHPELFGNVLSQSGAFWRGAEASNAPPYEWLTSQYAGQPRRDIRFFLDVGSMETRGALRGAAPSILDANRRLRDALIAKGYEVTYCEVPGGVHAPEAWRRRLPAGLVWITPR